MHHINNKILVLLMLIFSFLGAVLNPFSCAQTNNESEGEESLSEAIAWQQGPGVADLETLAEITLPEGYVFAGKEDTQRVMTAMGNIISSEEVGFFGPESLVWFVVFEFSDVGYVKDDEKNELDADAMLAAIRKGTEESNKARKENGFGALSVLGWEVPPRYNEETHNLEWAIRAQDSEGGLVVNHNTRVLGRKGVIKATLVVDSESLTETLPIYREQLRTLSFKPGNKYGEFREGDKIAKYGLATLVAGGAAAVAVKSGLFNYLWKALAVTAVGASVFFKRIFGRKSQI